MGHVLGSFDVRIFIKIAATAAVALLAFGAMANPAWAQDTTLSIDKTADRDPALAGKVLTYTIVVTNTGANQAENVSLTDALDFGTTDVKPLSVSVSTTQGSCGLLGLSDVNCGLGDLAPGAKATVTIRVEPTSQGTITNTAFAGADNAPGAAKSITTTVVPDLVIDKVGQYGGDLGGTYRGLPYGPIFFDAMDQPEPYYFTLSVTNRGETTADNVIVTDQLPEWLPWVFVDDRQGQIMSFVSVTSDDFTCGEDSDLIRCEGSIPAGATATATINVNLIYDPNVIIGSAFVVNTASVGVEGVPTAISSDKEGTLYCGVITLCFPSDSVDLAVCNWDGDGQCGGLPPVGEPPPGGEPPSNDTPKSKQECKKGGFRDFEDASGERVFKNQGQCIKAVNQPDEPASAKGPKDPPPGFDWNNNIP